MKFTHIYHKIFITGLISGLIACGGGGGGEGEEVRNSSPVEVAAPIAPQLALPDLSSSAFVFQKNQSVAELLINSGGKVASCNSVPSLPQGLLIKVDQNTCQISGSPTTVSAVSSYTVTAINARGHNDVVVNIEVKAESDSEAPKEPPVLAVTNLTGLINTSLSQLLINSGGLAQSCFSSPALPDGLAIAANADGCLITGKTATITQRDFLITAGNDFGRDTVLLTVNIDQPLQKPVISKLNNVNLIVGDQANIRFNNLGGDIESCTSSPLLSHGLSLKTHTDACVIDGAVSENINQRYDITATNAAGNSKAHVRIIVSEALQEPNLALIGSYTYDLDQMVSIVVVNDGGQLASCSVDPQLPAGLIITEQDNTCVITGTSSVRLDNQTYDVTASNASGSSSTQLNLTLDEPVVRTAVPLTLDVVADGYVNAGNKSSNVFNQDRLLTQSSSANYTREIYLAFNQQKLPTTEINNAYLKVFVDEVNANPGSAEIDIQKVAYSDQAENDRYFNEATLNYSQAEHFIVNGTQSSVSFTKFEHEQNWVWIDVSQAIGITHGVENLQLKITNSDEIKPSRLFLQSKEHAANHAPQLLINAELIEPILSINENNLILQTGQVITAKALSQGGLIESCSLAQGQTLPVGLSLSHENFACVVTGSTSFKQTATEYTVTASNGAGSSSIQLTLTVEAPATAPAITGESLTVIENMAINVLLANSGDAIESCALAQSSPALPSGLVLLTQENGCLISGTVSQDQLATNYIVTAMNMEGSSSANFMLTVNNPAPVLEDTSINQIYDQAVAISINNTGGLVDECRIDPLLPAGLILEKQNESCAITGSLSEVHNQMYTITGSNESGSDTAQVEIVLTLTTPLEEKPKLADTTFGVLPRAIFTVILKNTGGAIETCSGETFIPLPETLTVAPSIDGCVVSGYLLENKPVTSYVSASNRYGSDLGLLRLTINDPAPELKSISYDKAFDNDVEINLNNLGGAIDDCSVTPDLPVGLSLVEKNNTCAITGRYEQVYQKTFMVTGTNETASSIASVELNFTRPLLAPVLTDVNLTVSKNDYFSTTLTNSTDPVESCQSQPSLPVGLVLAATEQGCQISGAVAEAIAITTYEITASNITGSGTANFIFAVTDLNADSLKPALQNALESLTLEKNDPANLSFINTNAANLIDSCEIISGDLPTGLTITPSNNTCLLSGSTSKIFSERLITIAVGHQGNTVTAALYLTVTIQKPKIEDAVMQGATGEFLRTKFTSSRGNIESCSISPKPPSGLVFFDITCTLQGRQNQHYVDRDFTVTVRNSAGTDTATLTLNIIEPIRKPQISGEDEEIKVRINDAISVRMENGGRHNPIADCQANPPLPAGLNLTSAEGSCDILGAVAVAVTEADYVITASNEAGNSTAILTLDIRPAVVGDVHSITVNASDAVFVDQTAADDNYYDDKNLHANASRDIFMRFEASDISTSKIEKVYLEAFLILFDRKDPPLEICSTATDWQQETLTYNQVPADLQCQNYQLDNDDLAFWKLLDITELVKGHAGVDTAGINQGHAISLRLSVPLQESAEKTPRVEFASERTTRPRRNIAPKLFVNPHKQLSEFIYDEDVLQFRLAEHRRYVAPTVGGVPDQCTISPSLPAGINVFAEDFSCVIEGQSTQARAPQDYQLTASNGDGEQVSVVNIGIGNESFPTAEPAAVRAFVNGRELHATYTTDRLGRWQTAPFERQDTLRLHSNPQATVKVYIDMDGHSHGGVFGTVKTARPMLVKNNPDYGSDSNHRAVQQLWLSMAEVYSALDIDVTTEDPGYDSLARSAFKDKHYGTRLVEHYGGDFFKGKGEASSSLGRLSPNNEISPSLVFGSPSLSYTHNSQTAIHEFGHTIGFPHLPDDHSGEANVVDGVSYSGKPKGGGQTSHRGIMGGPSATLIQFLFENLQQIQHKPVTFRQDDHSNVITDATPMITVSDDETVLAHNGVIEFSSDIDVFSFQLDSEADINVRVQPSLWGTMLDSKIYLIDSEGTILKSANPLNQITSRIDATLEAGDYYLAVRGVGRKGRYLDISSLGHYNLVVNLSDATIAEDIDAALSLNKTFKVRAAESFTMNVLLNDMDELVEDSRLISVTGGEHGSVTMDANGEVTYLPDAGFVGYDSLTYIIDIAGEESNGKVNVEVYGPDGILTVSDTRTGVQNIPLNFYVLDNDASYNDQLKITAVTDGAKGSVVVNLDNTLSYIPEKNKRGADTFTYTVSDGISLKTETVNVNLRGATLQPRTSPDFTRTQVNRSVDIYPLSNDEGGSSVYAIHYQNEDGTYRTEYNFTQPKNGIVTTSNGKKFIYTPNEGFCGTDEFSYHTTKGGSVYSNLGDVTIDVAGGLEECE